MKRTFTYREKLNWGYVYLFVGCVVMIIYSLTRPLNIRYRSTQLLTYPESNYLVIAVSVLMILYVIHKLLKMKAVNSENNTIVISDGELDFKYLKGYSLTSVQVLFAEINKLLNENDDDDGESMVIYIKKNKNKNKYEFFAENFASAGEFAEFKKLLEQKCIEIANRS